MPAVIIPLAYLARIAHTKLMQALAALQRSTKTKIVYISNRNWLQRSVPHCYDFRYTLLLLDFPHRGLRVGRWSAPICPIICISLT